MWAEESSMGGTNSCSTNSICGTGGGEPSEFRPEHPQFAEGAAAAHRYANAESVSADPYYNGGIIGGATEKNGVSQTTRLLLSLT